MTRTKLFLACALAFVVSMGGTSASAQEPANQITYFEFSAPFELPGGKVLPAGKYTFRIVDSPSNRHIVQVMSDDRQTMHATLLAIPAQRMDPPDAPEVRFMETAANMPPAVRTWWYPGRTIGHEFIYPKDQARRLATRQSEGVLTVAGAANDTEQMRSADLTRIDSSGQESAYTAETTTAQTSAQTTADTKAETSNTGAMTQQSTTAQAGTQTTSQPGTGQVARPDAMTTGSATADAGRNSAVNARTELPQTASALPLIALLGFGSLLGAGALRLRR
jgi:hypothetical protein